MKQKVIIPILLEDLQKKYKHTFNEDKIFFRTYYEGILLFKDIIIEISRMINKSNNDGRKLAGGIYTMIFIEQMKNLDFFNAHYHLLKEGFCIPAYLPLRAILENIQRTYLYLVDDNHRQLIYNYSTIKEDGNPNSKEKKIIREYQKQKFYSPKKVRKLLYSKEKLKKLSEMYSVLSNYNHPSIKSTTMSYSYCDKAAKDVSESGRSLLCSNIWLLFECFGREFKDEIFTRALNFSRNLSCCFDLIPDNFNYVDRIKINSPEKFVEYLKNPSLKSNLKEVKFD